MHSSPLSKVIISTYREFIFQIHFDNLIMFFLFIFLGGLIGYLLYRFKTSQVNKDKSISLEELLENGESETIEFKSSLRWDYKQNKTNKEIELAVLKTIAAFMNTSGGNLLIGIDEDSNIIGLLKDYQQLKIKSKDGFEQFLMNIASLHLGPDCCKNIQIHFSEYQGKDVCTIKVIHIKTPVFLRYQQTTSFYVRTGNSTRELNIEEALKYFKTNKIPIN